MEHEDGISVVVAGGNERTRRWMLAALDEARLFCAGVAADGAEAVALVESRLPDILLCDVVLPIWDGLEVVRRVREMRLFVMPAVALMTPASMPYYEDKAMELGVCRVLHRPFRGARAVREIAEVCADARLLRSGMTRERVFQCLWELGLSPRLPGTRYLCRAIWLCALDGRRVNALAALYRRIAREYGVDAVRVSHAMRRAIETAWSGGALDVQHALFGNTIDARRGKPTNGEMIARIAELLRVKEI